ncbi:DivIVA domain-containing protein [Streptomyces sp. NPDC057702]|uniref:DivIVA domain-containing protein n=1 Tax=unclassified Streptomyces TaxID=2593676 RepID=UPI00368A390B
MFWFLLIALVAVVGAVTLVVVGGGDGAALPEARPDRLIDPLPEDRPLDHADVAALRLPVALRGYRMAEVDDALGRLGAELAERDARIAELEAVLAGAQATGYAEPGLIGELGAARAAPPPAWTDDTAGPDPDVDPLAGHGVGPAGVAEPGTVESDARAAEAMAFGPGGGASGADAPSGAGDTDGAGGAGGSADPTDAAPVGGPAHPVEDHPGTAPDPDDAAQRRPDAHADTPSDGRPAPARPAKPGVPESGTPEPGTPEPGSGHAGRDGERGERA